MLSNKKNLLQRVRIAMVAIVAILGIGGAFAMTPQQNQDAVTWGIVRTVGNSYEVTDLSAGDCDQTTTPHCEVQSAATPTSAGLIPKNGATIKQDVSGSFKRTNP